MKPLRVVVVDDEPLAREGMVELIERFPSVQVIGSFADGGSALVAIAKDQPDILFVDIQMPGMSGMELVESLPRDSFPQVVFVTAHDAYAIRAFELHAVDYLLKPVTTERLTQTIERVRRLRSPAEDQDLQNRVAAALATLMPDRPRGVGRLIVREVGQIVVVQTREIDWIEGADYYAKLHVGPTVHLLRETLNSLEQRLNPRHFIRVHRSAIVSLSRIQSVEAEERGAGIVVLNTGVRLKVTRERRLELERRLEGGEP